MMPTITTRAFAAMALLSSLLVYKTDAAASMSTTLECRTVDLDGITQDVCATYAAYTPSPAMLENGTTVYLGPYSYDFSFWDGLENGTDTASLANPEDYANTDLSVSVSWENGECAVQISGTDCSTCSICEEVATDMGQTTLSADCTNIGFARNVECEPAFIFYPMVALAAVSAPIDSTGGDASGGGSGNGSESEVNNNADSGAAVFGGTAATALGAFLATLIL